MTDDARPDRHALLELQALLTEIAALRSEGSADRFTADDRYRWVLHRLWIAAGNEALAYTQATGQPVRADRTWANLYDLRNHLAHSRLPDIDESLVRHEHGTTGLPVRVCQLNSWDRTVPVSVRTFLPGKAGTTWRRRRTAARRPGRRRSGWSRYF